MAMRARRDSPPSSLVCMIELWAVVGAGEVRLTGQSIEPEVG